MAVISGTDYLDIANAYANARDDTLNAKQFFFDAVYIIVLLQVIKPEVDLLNDFWGSYLINSSALTNDSLFLAATRSLNNHVMIEGGFVSVDAYLDDQNITVPQTWADLSATAGFTISADNIT